eukprot:TRINITY_DN5961_c0_g1_i1.p1 TRINITY_DN5961_c0_g1~~TRINITY_DN5961_c0_g1_i1.p1  ORF type:complete len:1093 (+),score=253.56 TRINITY_DN5961_c0_g1_i1:267-3281(+)
MQLGKNKLSVSIKLLAKIKQFMDWIWDVMPLPKALADQLNLTYGDNELCAIGTAHNRIEIWDWRQQIRVWHRQCEENCIIYSMAMHVTEDAQLIVAVGTVFNQIWIWHPLHSEKILTRLLGHEGAIFRIQWSTDGQRMCTTSDDRTARVWHNVIAARGEIAPFKSFYGHKARVWSCLFAGPYLITAAEDSTCLIWNIEKGEKLQSIEGHRSKSVWAIAIDPSLRILATGGGDSFVKLWDINHLVDGKSSGVEHAYDVPLTDVANVDKQKDEHVKTIKVVDDKSIVLSTNRGFVYRFDRHTLNWSQLHFFAESLQSHVVQYCTYYAPLRLLMYGDNFGTVTLMSLRADGSVAKVNLFTASALRIVYMHVHRLKEQSDDEFCLFVSTVEGELQLWSVNINEQQWNLIKTFKLGRRDSVWSIAVDEEYKSIVCGDGRGSIHLFDLPALSTALAEPSLPHFTLRQVHDQERVSCLLITKDKEIYSGGRNGHVNKFKFEGTPGQASVRLVKVSSAKAYKNMDFVESIFSIGDLTDVPDNDNDSGSEAESDDEQPLASHSEEVQQSSREHLMLHGFYGANAVYYDWSEQSVVTTIACGGSKRPYDCHYSALSNEEGADVQYCMAYSKAKQLHVYTTQPKERVFANTILHPPFHGRQANSVTLINDSTHSKLYFASTSEDTTVKLFKYDMQQPARSSVQCVQTLRQHTCSTRTIAFSQHPNSSDVLMFSGGGKLQLKCWRSFEVKQGSNSMKTFHLLSSLEAQSADTQCRIMELNAFPLPWMHGKLLHCIVASRSDAFMTVMLFDQDSKQFTVLGALRHGSPIVSLNTLQITHNDTPALLIFSGGTDGYIRVWDVTAMINTSSTETLQAIFEVKAHQLGADSMDIVEMAPNSYVLSSGGDDQSVFVAAFEVQTDPKLKLLNWRQKSYVDVHTSSIKGLQCDGTHVYTAGPDQRLNIWKIEHSSSDIALTWHAACLLEVADVSSIALKRVDNGRVVVIAVGDGMQVLEVTHK